MKIYIAADHGGFQLKEQLKSYLVQENYEVEDMGNKSFESADDYPHFIIPLAKKVAGGANTKEILGIILGRSGNGEAIAANKVKSARAAVCLNEEMAIKAREHNDANILSLGADYVNLLEAKSIVKAFLETDFSNEPRHVRRIQQIVEFENGQFS